MSIAEIEAREVALEPSSGLWSDAWRRMRRNPGAIVGFVLVSVFISVALFAPAAALAIYVLTRAVGWFLAELCE